MAVDKKIILDACCGGRMFWFNKNHPNTLYVDNRVFKEKLSNGQNFKVKPDKVMDFKKLKFKDKTFRLVVFDPPHLIGAGRKGWQAKKYGTLDKDFWKLDIHAGFKECWRVLKNEGVLIFKWNSQSKKLKEILDILPEKPLFGHTTNNKGTTHWMCFMKISK